MITAHRARSKFPYVFVDATYVKAHDGARVVSKAIVVATGVAADGNREVLGLAVGDNEDKAFWTAFLRSLRARGLAGVRLVISDAHEGLRTSIEKDARRDLAAVVSALSTLAALRRRSITEWWEGPASHSRRQERALAA